MRRLLHIVPFLFLLSACEVEITEDFLDVENLFIVSGQLTAGEALQLNLSRSMTLLQADTLLYLDNALVEVRMEGENYGLQPEGEGFYSHPDLRPEAGSLLDLQVSGEGLPPASVEVRIPEMPVVSDLRFEVDEHYDFTLELDLDDPAGVADYYEFYLAGWSRQVNFYRDSLDVEHRDTSQVYLKYRIHMEDPVMEYQGGTRGHDFEYYDPDQTVAGVYLFSDLYIDGQTHTLKVSQNLRNIYNDTIPELEVHLVKRDEHYFRYISTFMHYNPYPDQDFIQPVQVYSNIEGGFGLLTAGNPRVDTIDLGTWYTDPDFLDWMENPPD